MVSKRAIRKYERSKFRLSIKASFDTMPSDRELEEMLDGIRAHGGVDEAIFETVGPIKRDLLK